MSAMLLFSTILDTNDSFQQEDFIRLVLEWNDESAHEENRVKGIEWHGEHTGRYGTPDLWLEFIESPDSSIIAARHEKITSDGVVWDSDFIMNFAERKIAIQLDRTYSEAALVIDAAFSTPHFISLLIRQGCLKDDHDLPILRTPLLVSDDQEDLIQNVVFRNVQYKLPVILVFRADEGECPLDISWLSSRLKGAAHLLVEKDQSQCKAIREMCGISKDLFGAIKIYYPAGAIKEKKITYRTSNGD